MEVNGILGGGMGVILKKPITSMERYEREGGNEVAVEIHKVFLKVITFIKIHSSLSTA